MSPQKQKQRTQETFLAWLLEEAERCPVFCIWEDVHWADPSTLEFLGLFLERSASAKMLALLSFRPEFTPRWQPQAPVTQLTLGRLGDERTQKMVEWVTEGKTLPPEVLRQIVAKTDGVPLFVEELTKMVIESGFVKAVNGHYELVGPLPSLAIPTTLHDSLMARLDRLGMVKEVAQLGATIGREFTYDLIQAIAPWDETTLQHGLDQLSAVELLYWHGLPPHASYSFKHALIQETAYQSLLKSVRQPYHRQIAHVLEERLTDTAEILPELVAHHYTEAGLGDHAIPYWLKAGQRAIARSANVEAVRHLSQGVELLKTLPDTSERMQQELSLFISLGISLLMTRGHASPEVGKIYARALELCRQMGETPQLFSVLYGLRRFYLVKGEIFTAHELGGQMLQYAQNLQDSALLSWAHWALGEEFLPSG